MERPEIAVDNNAAVYEYFSQIELSVRALQRVHAATDRILHPRVALAPGTADDMNRINEQQIPHIYIFNHLSWFDWFVFLSTLHQVAPHDVGKVRSMGADFNFHWFKKSMPWISGGRLLDGVGGIPVFRRMDYPDYNLTPVQENLFNCVVQCLANGQVAAAAPEGKINETDDLATLLKFHSGIIEVGCRTANELEREVAYIPLGNWFGHDRFKKPKMKDASVYGGRALFVPPGSDKMTVTGQAQVSLQHAVTVSRELY